MVVFNPRLLIGGLNVNIASTSDSSIVSTLSCQ